MAAKRDKFLTAKQVSEYLCIPLRTIHRLSKDGKLKSIKIGKQWRYRKSDIEECSIFGLDIAKKAGFSERRACPRINSNFKCQYYINLPPFRNIISEGIIKDLGAGGISLIDKENEIGRIKINDPVDLCFEHMDIKGRIVRIKNNELGIKFRNIPDTIKSKIINYVG